MKTLPQQKNMVGEPLLLSQTLFADPGADIKVLKHQIAEAHVGYRIPRACHFVSSSYHTVQHLVFIS